MSIRRRFRRLALLATLVGAAYSPGAHADGEAGAGRASLAEWRDRFNLGMERYKAGALAEAIAYWEPIYRDLGPSKGYRVSYDLAIAYQEFGDATRAAERLESFLNEAAARHATGEPIERIVTAEEDEAKRRLSAIVATSGRIHVLARTPPIAVAVDSADARIAGFVAYVTPGAHTLTFGPGGRDATVARVVVGAGEAVDVAPPPEIPTPQATPSAPITKPLASDGSNGHRGSEQNDRPSTPRAGSAELSQTVRQLERPFHPAVLYVGGALAVASIAWPWAAYTHAANLRATYASSRDPGERQNIVNDYHRAQLWGDVALAAPITLGVATAGLAAWYFLKTHERWIIVPSFEPTTHAGGAHATGRVNVSGSF